MNEQYKHYYILLHDALRLKNHLNGQVNPELSHRPNEYWQFELDMLEPCIQFAKSEFTKSLEMAMTDIASLELNRETLRYAESKIHYDKILRHNGGDIFDIRLYDTYCSKVEAARFNRVEDIHNCFSEMHCQDLPKEKIETFVPDDEEPLLIPDDNDIIISKYGGIIHTR